MIGAVREPPQDYTNDQPSKANTMKTKLYAIITGLLMAACITSFGQEIVNEFTLQKNGKLFWNNDLFENEDGTLMFRTLMCNANTQNDWQHLFLKVTPEGEVLDSLSIETMIEEGWSSLLRNPLASDSYIFTEGFIAFDIFNSLWTANFRMVFIDAELNISNDIIIPLVTSIQDDSHVWWEPWFIDPQNDFILALWTDDVQYMIRVGFDGTIKTIHETTELLPPNYEEMPLQPDADSTLLYSEMGFGVFSEAPLTYYILGGYYPMSAVLPICAYFFDANFTLIETRWYEQYDEGLAFDGGDAEHFLPFDENSYLITAQINGTSPHPSGIGVARFDMNHNPISVSPPFGTILCCPLQTEITNGNTIYQLYIKAQQRRLSLARLDGYLNVNWDISLPINHMFSCYRWTTSMTILSDGRIIIGGINSMYSASFVIIRDNYDGTPETTNTDCPFTLCPNPAKNNLTLRFDDDVEPENVELYDLAGRLVGTKPNGLESIDISAMPSGVYLLRITTKDGTRYHEKIVKE